MGLPIEEQEKTESKKKQRAREMGLPMEAVERLGKELLTSKVHINNAPALLSLLSKALDSPSPTCTDAGLLQALLYLKAFFSPILSHGELNSRAFRHAQQTLQSKAGEQANQAEAVYVTWLWQKYNDFVDILLRITVSPAMPSAAQVASVDTLMEFVRLEKQGTFCNRLYSKLCSTLVLSKHSSSIIIEHLVASYFMYMDVCFHTCICLRKLLVTYQGLKQKAEEVCLEDGLTVDNTSLQSLTSNGSKLLMYVNVPKINSKDSESAVIETWTMQNGQDCEKAADVKTGQAVVSKTSEQAKFTQVKKFKSKVSRAWLAFLQLPLTAAVCEKVLGHMHKVIIPNLSNPLLLSDFLTNSYNKGGLVSVMALGGLFSLITEYGLEYPDFYNKLYALLEPSIFIAKYRARFFELLDLSLKSPLLPSYLAAAFAKKLGRIALKSPPAGALIVIAIVHNLLRRHPSINCLVHQNSVVAAPVCPDLVEALRDQESLAAAGEKEIHEIHQAGECLGRDPFVLLEPDPAHSNALKSSLWEMDTLRRHYSPVVSRFVASLEADLTVRSKTTELNVKDFSSGSYATIFSEEVKRRMKHVPLAFYKSVPTTLFPKASENQSPELVDFPGWSFGCKQTAAEDKQSNKEIRGENDLKSSLAKESTNSTTNSNTKEHAMDCSSKKRKHHRHG